MTCKAATRRRAPHARAGFTLLEVMVAMGILATALVVLLQNHGYSVRMSEKARQLTRAAVLARDKMTEIELAGYPEVDEDSGDFGELYPGFRWEIVVADSLFNEVREVHLTVLWGPEEFPERLELVNFIASYQEGFESMGYEEPDEGDEPDDYGEPAAPGTAGTRP